MGDRGWDIDAVARVAARNLRPKQPSLPLGRPAAHDPRAGADLFPATVAPSVCVRHPDPRTPDEIVAKISGLMAEARAAVSDAGLPAPVSPMAAALSPWRWGDGVLVVRIPLETKNEANLASPHAKFVVASYRKKVHKAVRLALEPVFPRWTELPVVVTLTRHSAGHLDPHDGLPNAFKAVVDEIAEWLPLPKKPFAVRTKAGVEKRMRADDSDPRVTWKYDQQKSKPGTAWVTACFVARADIPQHEASNV